MAIVVQDVGTGLIQSSETDGFIESQSRDDKRDNELEFLHFSPEMSISFFLLCHLFMSSKLLVLT